MVKCVYHLLSRPSWVQSSVPTHSFIKISYHLNYSQTCVKGPYKIWPFTQVVAYCCMKVQCRKLLLSVLLSFSNKQPLATHPPCFLRPKRGACLQMIGALLIGSLFSVFKESVLIPSRGSIFSNPNGPVMY